jgi:excisionase family DNA binding protein
MTNKIIIPDKPFFRVDEIADILGVSKQTVYNWINTDKINYTRIGSIIRIPREAFDLKKGAGEI